MIFNSMLDAVSLPRLVYPCRAECPNLVAAVFEYMKRIPAEFCARRALEPGTAIVLDRQSGLFAPISPSDASDNLGGLGEERDGERRIVIETSSGNMAAGLAEVCKQLDLRLHLVIPSRTDEVTQNYLKELGAELEIIDTPDQTRRVKRIEEIKDQHEREGWRVWWIDQYGNRYNWMSYWRLAEFLVSELDRIDKLVAPVGTGGSSRGTAHFLRGAGFRDLELVGVDACGSVNFELSTYTKFLMSGLGSSRKMPLIDLDAYDAVHWIDDTTGFAATVELFDRSVPVGGSSGAAFVAARYEAQQAPDKTVLVIFPDHARRYAHTIRSEEWRKANGIVLATASQEPQLVDHPRKSDPSLGVPPAWYRIDWRAYRAAALSS